MFKFNTVGKILKGEYPGWYIVIIDKRKHKENNLMTGGIYIFQSDNIEFSGMNGGIVYDDWVQDLNGLEVFFSEPEWEIQWLDIENPIKMD